MELLKEDKLYILKNEQGEEVVMTECDLIESYNLHIEILKEIGILF